MFNFLKKIITKHSFQNKQKMIITKSGFKIQPKRKLITKTNFQNEPKRR